MLFYLAKGHFHACAAVVPMPGWMAWLKRTVNACWRVFLSKICILAFNQRRFAQIFYSKYAGSETVTTAVVVWVRRRRRQPIMIDDDNRNNSRIHFLHLSRAIKKTWIHIWFESWWWRCWESEQSFVAELTHILPCKMYYYYICANTLNVNVRMLRWVLTHKIKFIERIAFETEIHTTNDELANIIHYVLSSPTLFSFTETILCASPLAIPDDSLVCVSHKMCWILCINKVEKEHVGFESLARFGLLRCAMFMLGVSMNLRISILTDRGANKC